MAKRMNVSCIPFTVPTSQEGKASTRVTCSMSSARRRVPCSAETDKRRGYAHPGIAACVPWLSQDSRITRLVTLQSTVLRSPSMATPPLYNFTSCPLEVPGHGP